MVHEHDVIVARAGAPGSRPAFAFAHLFGWLEPIALPMSMAGGGPLPTMINIHLLAHSSSRAHYTPSSLTHQEAYDLSPTHGVEQLPSAEPPCASRWAESRHLPAIHRRPYTHGPLDRAATNGACGTVPAHYTSTAYPNITSSSRLALPVQWLGSGVRPSGGEEPSSLAH